MGKFFAGMEKWTTNSWSREVLTWGTHLSDFFMTVVSNSQGPENPIIVLFSLMFRQMSVRTYVR